MLRIAMRVYNIISRTWVGPYIAPALPASLLITGWVVSRDLLRGFYPQMVATFVGALAGVPVGLYVNERVKSRQYAEAQAERKRRLEMLLGELKKDIDASRRAVKATSDSLEGGYITIQNYPGTEVWDVNRVLLSQLCEDPALQRRFARFYSDLRWYTTGLSAYIAVQGRGNAPDTSGRSLRHSLLSVGNQLNRHADELLGAM